MQPQPYRAWYGTQRWRRTSALVVARAGGMCETPGCSRRATTADHVVAALILAERGRLDLFFALDNLVAACRPCNSARGAALVNGRRRGRRMANATRAAEEWARQYMLDQERLARERLAAERAAAPRPRPAIY